MGINLVSPTAFSSAALVYDTVAVTGGSTDSTASMTKVAGVTVAAALEVQSTNGALLLPRMTAVQIAALTPVVDGMMAYDSTNGTPVVRSAGVWGGQSELFSVVTLTQANIQGMFAVPVSVLPAPGAGKTIIVHKATLYNNFNTAAFATGGDTVLQYGNAANGAGTNSLAIPFPAAFINSAVDALRSADGETDATLINISNTGIFISNQTAAFTLGNAASTVVVNIWYSIINANVGP